MDACLQEVALAGTYEPRVSVSLKITPWVLTHLPPAHGPMGRWPSSFAPGELRGDYLAYTPDLNEEQVEAFCKQLVWVRRAPTCTCFIWPVRADCEQ